MATQHYWLRENVNKTGSGLFPVDPNGFLRIQESLPSLNAGDTVQRVMLDIDFSLVYKPPVATPPEGWWSRLAVAVAVGVYPIDSGLWPDLYDDDPSVVVTGFLTPTQRVLGQSEPTANVVTLTHSAPLDSHAQRRVPFPDSLVVLRTSMSWFTLDGIGEVHGQELERWNVNGYMRTLWAHHG